MYGNNNWWTQIMKNSPEVQEKNSKGEKFQNQFTVPGSAVEPLSVVKLKVEVGVSLLGVEQTGRVGFRHVKDLGDFDLVVLVEVVKGHERVVVRRHLQNVVEGVLGNGVLVSLRIDDADAGRAPRRLPQHLVLEFHRRGLVCGQLIPGKHNYFVT